MTCPLRKSVHIGAHPRERLCVIGGNTEVSGLPEPFGTEMNPLQFSAAKCRTTGFGVFPARVWSFFELVFPCSPHPHSFFVGNVNVCSVCVGSTQFGLGVYRASQLKGCHASQNRL